MDSGEPTHYSALGVHPSASADEVKRAFRQAALRLHPDKAAALVAADTTAGGGDEGSSAMCAGAPGPTGAPPAPSLDAAGAAGAAADAAAAEYLRVQEAWVVLSDPAQRAAYDRQLALEAAARQVAVSDTQALSALQPATLEGEECLVWPCRCGGCFAVVATEAAEAATEGSETLLLPCTTCSLHICVTLPPH